MKECNHCHQSLPESQFYRNTTMPDGYSRDCKECHRIACAKWEKNNPEKRKEQTARYRSSDTGKSYKDSIRDEQKDYMKGYYHEHKDKWAFLKYRRKARVESNGGHFTKAQFKELCERYGNICLCCKQSKPLVADHVIPLVKGGSNDISNIQPLCQPCNRKKHMESTDYRF